MSVEVPAPLRAIGWSDRVAALLSDSSYPARVARVDRDRCVVVTATGEDTATFDEPVGVGDWVALEPTPRSPAPWHVASIATRWSVLQRVDPRSVGRTVDLVQILAANIDLIASVVPLDRSVSVSRIERELVAIWDAGAKPLVVLSKADQHADPAAVMADLAGRLVGTEIICTSSADGTGIEELAERVTPGLTVMLLGASGGGKSTLVNALAGEEVMATGVVRVGDHRGRHTTTARCLIALPNGGVLLDSPGIRSLGMLAGTEGVEAVFDDITSLAEECRFRDCEHRDEPGCAVHGAIESGALERGRLDSWHKLQREVLSDRRRIDPLAAAAHHAEVRRRGRQIKQAKANLRKR